MSTFYLSLYRVSSVSFSPHQALVVSPMFLFSNASIRSLRPATSHSVIQGTIRHFTSSEQFPPEFCFTKKHFLGEFTTYAKPLREDQWHRVFTCIGRLPYVLRLPHASFVRLWVQDRPTCCNRFCAGSSFDGKTAVRGALVLERTRTYRYPDVNIRSLLCIPCYP